METRYSFGKNWLRYLEKDFSEERLDLARRCLLESLGVADLHGQRVLDIGCGSGIHSLAMLRAGADEVQSFDYDADSVAASRFLWEREGRPANWEVRRGDVLDRTFMENLGSFELVYSWGVLHHTGDVARAFTHASLPLSENGALFVALYSRTFYSRPAGEKQPEDWIRIKRRYNEVGRLGKRGMEAAYLGSALWRVLARNPLAAIARLRRASENVASYGESRGMGFYSDIRDWLGGYPMEFVDEWELIEAAKAHGLRVLDLQGGEGCTEFLFARSEGRAASDDAVDLLEKVSLEGPFRKGEGRSWTGDLGPGYRPGRNRGMARPIVLEDGIPLLNGFGEEDVDSLGGGRCSIVGSQVVFSTLDGSDPNENGRVYTLRRPPESRQ